MRVLITDDDPGIRYILKTFMSMMNHEADLAENGLQALEMLENDSYDVVITDGFMPEMTGFELCRIIRQRYPGTYVLGITGSSKVRDFEEAGAHAFYYKPIRFDELQNALSRFYPHADAAVM